MDGIKILSQTQILTTTSFNILILLSIIFGIILALVYYKLGERNNFFKSIVNLFPPIIIWFAGFVIGFPFFENIIPFNYENRYEITFIGSVNMDEFYEKYVVLDSNIEKQTLTVMLKEENKEK